jgi:hypothetical protein
MKAPNWLPNLVLCIGLLLISINIWYVVYIPRKYKKEAFVNADISDTVNNLLNNNTNIASNPPSDLEVVQNYRKLLLYIKGNSKNGLKIINDFSTRIYGKITPIPSSFDPRTVLDGFKNPINGM